MYGDKFKHVCSRAGVQGEFFFEYVWYVSAFLIFFLLLLVLRSV